MATRDPQELLYYRWMGRGIEQVRAAADLTQPELAELIGVSKQTIYNLENGVVAANPLRVRMIAEACAERGSLPDDPDAIEEFIAGRSEALPLVMRRDHRPRLGLVGDGGQPLTRAVRRRRSKPHSGQSKDSNPDLTVRRLLSPRPEREIAA